MGLNRGVWAGRTIHQDWSDANASLAALSGTVSPAVNEIVTRFKLYQRVQLTPEAQSQFPSYVKNGSWRGVVVGFGRNYKIRVQRDGNAGNQSWDPSMWTREYRGGRKRKTDAALTAHRGDSRTKE